MSILKNEKNAVIILLGPTGVGKTETALKLAKALNTEIVSADSMLLYKSMDIGTAKPSIKEMNEVKHHLIDFLEPANDFSAGLFKQQATAIIESLHQKGKVPLVVGGTGLYIKTLTTGLFEGPHADWDLRKKLLEKEKKQGKGYLYHCLMGIDADAALKIHPHDLRRTVRMLEICLTTGERASKVQLNLNPKPYLFIKIGLYRRREELYDMINRRVDKMLKLGLVEETKKLRLKKVGRAAMHAIGYKEIGMYLDGLMSLEESVDLLKKRTRNYAKRQLTWFRKEPEVHWIDITGIYESAQIIKKIIHNVAFLKGYVYH